MDSWNIGHSATFVSSGSILLYMPYIYKITSPTNKIYIGQTWNLKKRVYQYSKIKCKTQPKLYASLKKYGWENHILKVVSE